MKTFLVVLIFLLCSCSKKANMTSMSPKVESISGKPVFIRIFKKENMLELWYKKDQKYSLFKEYTICTWSGSLGPKLKEGDGQSPEGFYFVPYSMLKPDSSYHRAFNIGFPNEYDQSYYTL